MRPKKVKHKRLSASLFSLAFGLLFAVVLIQSSNSARDAGNPAAEFTIAFYFLAFTLTVAVHETGHLIAGWFVGFRFSFISIGPFSLKLEYGRLKLSFKRGMLAAGYAGMHIGDLRQLRRRLLIFTIAGPLANLLSAGAVEIFLYSMSSTNGIEWLSLPARIFWQVSAFIGLVNLIPIRLGALYNDGARIC
jgi:hypothetical protein